MARLRGGIAQGLIGSGLEKLALRWRFRLVVMAFAVPFLGHIVWAATQQAALERRHIHEEARAEAALLAARLEDQVDQIDLLLATAAHAVGRNLADVPAVDALLQNMRSFMPKAVDNIGVWALDGRSIVALDRRSASRPVNIADRRFFKDAVERRDFAFEGPVVSRLSGTAVLLFARPIFDPQNKLVGVLSISMRPNGLVGLLDQSGVVQEKALVTIIDRDGIVVTRSIDPATWIGKPLPSIEGVPEIFSKRSGIREEDDADGNRNLTGYAVAGKWPWAVTVDEPVDQVLASTSARLLRNLGVGLVIFAFAFVIAGRVGAWTTRPLIRLANDTERLRRGELSHRSDVVTGGEIGLLAANFNEMAKEIEEREKALAASRTRLHQIANNVPAQVYYIDREERYRYVNEHRGPAPTASPAGMLGLTIREVRGEELYQVLRPHVRRALSGEPSHVEAPHTVDGRVYHTLYAYVPDRDDAGEVVGIYCFAQDITERTEADIKRIESERRLRTITDNLPAMICYVDDHRNFRFVNRAFEKWFERPMEDIIGRPFDRLMAPNLAAQYGYHFVRSLQGETCEYEMEVPTFDGTTRWLKCSLIPDVDDADGHVRGVYGMIHNVTKAKQAEQRLTRLAQFDSLTEIANRNQFNETLARGLAEHLDNPRPLALMFLDIDHFKQVNDRFGHACGDMLLKDFARRLVGSVRPTDAVARLAGDEFVVLLEGMHSDEEPQFIARKIIAAIEKPFVLDDRQIDITTSIGIAMRAHPEEAASALMKRADEALYEAKRAGRNTFRMAS